MREKSDWRSVCFAFVHLLEIRNILVKLLQLLRVPSLNDRSLPRQSQFARELPYPMKQYHACEIRCGDYYHILLMSITKGSSTGWLPN
jgi:hypothetical protein